MSVRPSFTVRPSVHHPATSVRLSYVCPYIQHLHLSVTPSATITPSVRHTNQSIRPSATVTLSVRHTNQSVRMSVTSRLSDRHYDSSTHTSIIPHDSLYPRFTALTSSREWEQSHTIHRTQDSSQSLAVMNGEQLHKAKKFHRAFINYGLLLRALDASSIFLCDLRCVAPPKSGRMLMLHVASVILVELSSIILA